MPSTSLQRHLMLALNKGFFMLSFFVHQLLSIALAAPAPVKSNQPLEYISKTENKMMDLFKTDNFLGVLNRPQEKNQDLSMVDLYLFKEPPKLSMDEKLCKEFLVKIYGNLNTMTLKLAKLEIYTSHTGKTCEAQIVDPDKMSKIPERRTVIGFLNAKPYGVVFQLSKKSTPATQESIREFWDSLR
jgi:hypothetical protein